MTPAVRALGLVQSLSLFALVAVFVRPRAAWSLRARLPVALLTFASSAALLLVHTL